MVLSNGPGIETARLLLRQWRESDIDALARVYENDEVMRYMPRRLDRAGTLAQVERMVGAWTRRGLPNAMWALEEKQSGMFIGHIGLLAHDDWTATEHNTEVGWLIAREWWGLGLATEGGQASLDYGFTTLRLPHIISITVPENTASRLVMEKLGLTLEGENEWHGLHQGSTASAERCGRHSPAEGRGRARPRVGEQHFKANRRPRITR